MRNTVLLVVLLIGLSGCVKYPQLVNFNEGMAFPNSPISIENIPVLKVQYDDLLSIKITALDIEAALPFNIDSPTGNQNLNTGIGVRPLIGYLVNKEGEINFPVLGKLSVAGLTLMEIQEMLAEQLQPYLKGPVIAVRFLNFRVTVLGEVARPATFFMSNERVTLLDALGQAGDMTPYASRTNILVIREHNGERTFARLNLQDRNVFTSPFFYLQQNDVIYVEPLPTRTASIRDQSQRILPWLSAITALTTLALTLSRL